MIIRLTLERFGRFRRSVFELSPVTVLFGPNEAGKTTFFDGLFQALCRPGESKKAGRLLKERYGPGRSAEAVFSDADFAPLSDDEFLNLYAIRAGDLKLEMTQGTDWLERLKTRLFLGGVDPAALAADFEKRASDSRTMLHNKELDKAREDAAKAGQDLDSHRRERDSLLARETALGDVESRLRETQELRMAAQDEAREVEDALALEEKTVLKERLSEQLARLEELENDERESLDPHALGEESREAWNRLAEATRTASEAVQLERGRLHALREATDRLRAEWTGLRQDLEGSAGKAQDILRLSSEARDFAARKSGRLGLPGWSSGLAIGILILGAVGAALLAGAYGAATLGLAFLSAGAALIFGRWSMRIQDRARASRALIRWKAQWAREPQGSTGDAGRSGLGEIDSVEGFLRFLAGRDAERKGLEAREAEALKRLKAMEDALGESEKELRTLREEEGRSLSLEQAWLARHGTASAEELVVKLSRHRRLLADLPRRRREMEAEAPGGDLAACRRDLVRRLRALDEEGVPGRGVDDAGLQRLRNRRRNVLASLEDLGIRERKMIADREGLAGEIRGALGKMAAGIVACEDRLAAAESRIKSLERDKKAAAVAMEIFRGMGDGSGSLLEELASDIGFMLAGILPRKRGLSVPALDGRRISATDAGGSVRSLEHLSTGTKDAVVLAARLALALKHRGPSAGILALDEPFLAMDEDRETRALHLLRDFHARYGWQIILLTKDARLRDKAMAMFPAPSLLNLAECV